MAVSSTEKQASHQRKCQFCSNEMPITRTNCPHCAQPQLFPNVDLAKIPEEKQKLDSRFKAALLNAKRRNCESILEDFTSACSNSFAVFSCFLLKLFREMGTGTEIFETYHNLEQLRLRTTVPREFDWEKLRPQAEIELLGNAHHLDKIHYACLSINEKGISSYGDCVVVLSESLISHRTSCFEGNSAIIYAKKHGFSEYLRCEWSERGKICTAKLVAKIHQSTTEGDFPGILIENGEQSEDDQFIELHIFGAMTAKTFESISTDTRNHTQRERTFWNVIEDKLRLSGVSIEVIS